MEMSDRLLPREDKEVGECLSRYFIDKLGMMILPHARVVAIEPDGDTQRIVFVNEGREKLVRTEAIVLATGSRPEVDCGLENAGVKYRNSGVIVDKSFATSARNIFAIGDVIGGESSTERASYQGAFLVNSLVGRHKVELDYSGFARVTKTFPEVATVGLSEDDLLRRDRKYRKVVLPLSEIPAGKIYDFEDGFVKLISDMAGHILGATVVAPGAELMVQEIALALRQHLTVLDLASLPHAENSYAQAIKIAAQRLALIRK